MISYFKLSSRRVRAGLAICSMATLLGCAQRRAADQPIPLNGAAALGPQSAVLLPGADYHLVTVRRRDLNGPQIFCSEPSPDWAVAFGTALGGSLSVGVNGGNGSVSGNSSTTEAITAMLGRTAGVVALRDGLYSACQAYANGVIGKDGYALILSQYGNLLVALAGAGGSSGAGGGGGGGGGTSTPGGVAVAVSTGGTTSSGTASPIQAGSSGAGSAGSAQVAQLQQQVVQALIVSCISSNDPTLHTGALSNAFLKNVCPAVQSAVKQVLPDLMRPVTTSSNSQTVPATTPKRKPAKG